MCECSVFPVIDLPGTGRNIQRLRERAGVTVRELQAYFGFEYPQAIYKWQHGECLPSVDNLLALARVLRVPMEDLLVYDDREVSHILAALAEIVGYPWKHGAIHLFRARENLTPRSEKRDDLYYSQTKPYAPWGIGLSLRIVLNHRFNDKRPGICYSISIDREHGVPQRRSQAENRLRERGFSCRA